ncbi:MAG TPA: tryptophan 2,3-dioxygenase family protein [bacterium]|nr:tryptophan 2,3-dioxygenase family protein [bacterium]HMY35884.1 tryptophan 2,3-dioxygenase family protein [bacterium]HNB10774.1 tryptophan 2,3-dioxygenase family protein [bacterium]HND75923.1 tryptophan 2,3-dioxygenase family protein [bacterium]HNH30822.1 tryptophan 2,3-dioxygenase family protein [bacterium]
MEKPYPPVYYADYLELNQLLGAQHPKSDAYGKPAHDEMLFIIIHQAYELWFKQILHEVDSVARLFAEDHIDEKNIGIAVARLQRVTEIQKILVDQLRILETMTPLDFLEFRDFLVPASGFQSVQFRLIENKLGLKHSQRLNYGQHPYHDRLSKEHQSLVQTAEQSASLLELVERWLERTPFLELGDFNFWSAYRGAVTRMLDEDHRTIEHNVSLSPSKKEEQLKQLDLTRINFDALFDENKHNQLMKEGVRTISYRATQAALLICLYRDQPILHQPFRLITLLVDIDEMFTTWRYRHALMVHRMIGTKIGTGGSSGHQYLKGTSDQHKIFSDFFNLSTFLIPRSSLPKLPGDVERNLGFVYSQKQ